MNTIRALAAAALITADYFPEKLSPLINPLLRGVEKQRQEQLQKRSATALGLGGHDIAQTVSHVMSRYPGSQMLLARGHDSKAFGETYSNGDDWAY